MPYKNKEDKRRYDRERRAARTPAEVKAEKERLQQYAAEHPDAVRASQHKYASSDKGRATKAEWIENNRDKVNAYCRAWYQDNKEEESARRRAANAAARAALLKLLGTKCARCRYDDMRALQIDHIHNDGAADRRRFKIQSTMYRYYLKHPAEARRRLQTLCANCNFIKESETEFGHRARRRP